MLLHTDPFAAGKGRSGTLACAYLLTLEQAPSPPRLQRSYTAAEWAERRAEMLINEVETDEDELPDSPAPQSATEPVAPSGVLNAKEAPLTASPSPSLNVPPPDSTATALFPTSQTPAKSQTPPKSESTKPPGTTLESVIALHTSRRMQTAPDASKGKQGVSIPSQRRFLGYWSRLIEGAAPPGIWHINDAQGLDGRQRVQLGTIRVTMRDDASLKQRGMRFLNTFLDRAVGGGSDGKKGKGDVWVSLAR